jgi:predicted transcriptional regulator of viral defense system
MEKTQSVRSWIEDLPKRGRILFCADDLRHQFPDVTDDAIRLSIYRLKNKGRICSVWRKFYVVVPDEYALRGFVPPIEYIEKLMDNLGHKYYVGLLSAAALHGSSHQQPQSFTVAVNTSDIRSKKDKNVSVRFFTKSQIVDDHLLRRNASYGEINISDPIMTVLDLILYENRIGGLERAAEVIDGLIDVLEITDTSSELWRSFPIPVIQRFGFILDSILSCPELGDMLYQKTRNINITFRRILLDPKSKLNDSHECLYDPKWKIVINTDLELDQ